jgi:GMP synthase-like glutamine amidotransferase
MIHALYHAPAETLGLIKTCLDKGGRAVAEHHLYGGCRVPPFTRDMKALIIMGGPMSVHETHIYSFLDAEVELIKQAAWTGLPVLGICLGAQLIAKALGSRVYPNSVREVGWHPIELLPAAHTDRLLSGAPQKFDVLHWHGDTFDLPPGAVHLARSNRCVHQAFHWHPLTWGLQFHLEITPHMIEAWVQDEESVSYVHGAGENPQEIVKKTPIMFSTLQPLAEQIFLSFLDAV